MIKIGICGDQENELEEVKIQLQTFGRKNGVNFEITLFTDWRLIVEVAADFQVIAVKDIHLKDAIFVLQEKLLSQNNEDGHTKLTIVLTDWSFPLCQETMYGWYTSAMPKEETINIPIKGGSKRVLVEEILYFENINRKIFMHTIKDQIQTTLTMQEVKKIMKKFYFASPYVSFYVNLKWIEKIKGYDVFLKNSSALPLSQKQACVFRKEYNELLSILT